MHVAPPTPPLISIRLPSTYRILSSILFSLLALLPVSLYAGRDAASPSGASVLAFGSGALSPGSGILSPATAYHEKRIPINQLFENLQDLAEERSTATTTPPLPPLPPNGHGGRPLASLKSSPALMQTGTSPPCADQQPRRYGTLPSSPFLAAGAAAGPSASSDPLHRSFSPPMERRPSCDGSERDIGLAVCSISSVSSDSVLIAARKPTGKGVPLPLFLPLTRPLCSPILRQRLLRWPRFSHACFSRFRCRQGDPPQAGH